jgi:putative oxidoreductase
MSHTITSQPPAAPAVTRRRALTVMLWALQALLAVQFAAAGRLKLSGAQQMVDLFTQIGAGQWLRYLVGALELAGAVGLLLPRLSGLAALGLAGLLVGATATNLLVIDRGPWLPLGLLPVAALVAWARWPQTKTLSGTRRR